MLFMLLIIANSARLLTGDSRINKNTNKFFLKSHATKPTFYKIWVQKYIFSPIIV